MKNLVIFEGIDKLGDSVVIKTVRDRDDFNKALRVFQNPPYNEILSDSECDSEYASYDRNGIVFGAFIDSKIAGINCILNDVPQEYGIGFYDKDKVAYYAGLAVLEEYRKRGLGKLLVEKTQNYIEQNKSYDYSFARILCEGSMSEGIFRLNNFIDANDSQNKLIVDEVMYERNDSSVSKADRRKFMVKTLNKNGNGWYRK
jgi:GNAT superfamily N-acetyltransferase